ncbi:MAG: PilZ domain-containing protein [Terriglobia bacterium]
MVKQMTFSDANEQHDMTGLQDCEGSQARLSPLDPSPDDSRLAPGVPEEQAVRRFSVGERQRAQRFRIHAPLRYRTAGEGEWRAGMMVNISESGVLFQADHRLGSNPKMETRFSLSTGTSGEAVVQVVCRGVIARTVTGPESTRMTALAMRITKFQFLRPGTAVGV